METFLSDIYVKHFNQSLLSKEKQKLGLCETFLVILWDASQPQWAWQEIEMAKKKDIILKYLEFRRKPINTK